MFYASKYGGKPNIMECDKCNELKWFNIDELPDEIIDTKKIMLENYKTKNLYSEYGFNEK